MEKKIIGILICMLFIITALSPVLGSINEQKNTYEEKTLGGYQYSLTGNKYAWSNKGNNLDNKAVIQVDASEYYTVTLSFMYWCKIISPDVGKVELSNDGGNVWFLIGEIGGSPFIWITKTYDLSAYAGQILLIRFRYVTVGNSTSTGWDVDNIKVNDIVIEDFEGYSAGDKWGDWVIVGKSENQRPTVTITYPIQGDIVSGLVEITGVAHDPDGDSTIQWVMLQIDGDDWVYATGISNWSYVWDTTMVSDGLHTISAIASDGSLQSVADSVSVTVNNGGPSGYADLIVTDIWNDDDMIYYQVRNIGNGSTAPGYYTALFIDDEYKTKDILDTTLQPTDRFTSSFNYPWLCSNLNDNILVIADYENHLNESDETNNERVEFWKCDNIAPEIIYGPIVQDITLNSAVIYWKTNEDSDSKVIFDDDAGEYENLLKNSDLVKAHSMKLTSLVPMTTYHFIVESMDVSENVFRSSDYIFETLSPPDTQSPLLDFLIPDQISGIVNIYAKAWDDNSVDKMILLCDEMPITTDYSGDVFNHIFDTTGLTDGNHFFNLKAFDYAGNVRSEAKEIDVINHFPIDNSPVHVTIIIPKSREILQPSIIQITANLDHDNNLPVYADVYINDELLISGLIPEKNTIVGTGENQIFTNWDLNPLPPGDYTIKVIGYDTEGQKDNHIIMVTRDQDPPVDVPLTITRTVTKMGNTYNVDLEIWNRGNDEDDTMTDVTITDNCSGFVALCEPYIYNDVTTDASIKYIPELKKTQVIKKIPKLDGRIHITYSIVPVLYEQREAVSYYIGECFLPVDYIDYMGTRRLVNYASDVYPSDTQRPILEDILNIGNFHINYIIVTNPQQLFYYYDDNDVNVLLSKMAELAIIRDGILGFISPKISSTTLKDLIKEGGMWSNIIYQPLYNDLEYVLFVGENNIIPTVNSVVNSGNIKYTDHYYADTWGDEAPDLAVGRILGRTAQELIIPIQTSIDVFRKFVNYDDSDGLIVCSGDDAFEGFSFDGRDLMPILSDAVTNLGIIYGERYITKIGMLREALWYDSLKDMSINWGNQNFYELKLARWLLREWLFQNSGINNLWDPDDIDDLNENQIIENAIAVSRIVNANWVKKYEDGIWTSIDLFRNITISLSIFELTIDNIIDPNYKPTYIYELATWFLKERGISIPSTGVIDKAIDEAEDLQVDRRGFDVGTYIYCDSLADTWQQRNTAVKSVVSNKDFITYKGHGNWDSWCGVFDNWSPTDCPLIPISFGNTRPLILGTACLTGDYTSNNNIARGFLKNNAAIYIGGTEDTYSGGNNELCKDFCKIYDNFLEAGLILQNTKDELFRIHNYLFEVYVYNLYGDPKFSSFGITDKNKILENKSISSSYSMPDHISITIPDYIVETLGNLDYVSIPDGELLIEEGWPILPYYSVSFLLPQKYKVTDVILEEKSDVETISGLRLPIGRIQLASSNNKGQFNQKDEGWYPKKDFSWKAWDNANETTTLIINIFPFFYNPNTTAAEFYKNYRFDINSIYSDISITKLDVDKSYYEPGDKMIIDLWLNNTGERNDIVTSLIIKKYGDDQIVEGLPLRVMKNCEGTCSYSTTWDTSNMTTGLYYIEATITETTGDILDKKIEMFDIPSAEIKIASIKGGFGVSATLDNNGPVNGSNIHWSINLEGNLVFFGGYKEGDILILKPGETFKIKSGLVLGFGQADITVNVAGVSKKASCFLVGPIVLNIKET